MRFDYVVKIHLTIGSTVNTTGKAYVIRQKEWNLPLNKLL
jgi:hypothetical protein